MSLSIIDTQHSNTLYRVLGLCRVLFIVALIVIMFSIVMLYVVMLSVVVPQPHIKPFQSTFWLSKTNPTALSNRNLCFKNFLCHWNCEKICSSVCPRQAFGGKYKIRANAASLIGRGRLLALFSNIWPACKRLLGTNTLAYFTATSIRRNGMIVLKTFFLPYWCFRKNKLECLSVARVL